LVGTPLASRKALHPRGMDSIKASSSFDCKAAQLRLEEVIEISEFGIWNFFGILSLELPLDLYPQIFDGIEAR
jgi:hypothetical protein